ncbi:MAG TPA: adenylate/guanylate cyclase domain-containing protein [Chlorobiota bacterium]|nr:adenylate/guanylate cyclase domain-containing protein [Chlorobiota bacterium]
MNADEQLLTEFDRLVDTDIAEAEVRLQDIRRRVDESNDGHERRQAEIVCDICTSMLKYATSQVDEAFALINRALDSGNDNTTTTIDILALEHLAKMFRETGKRFDAIDTYVKAADVSETLNQHRYASAAYLSAAITSRALGILPLALSYARKSLMHAELTGRLSQINYAKSEIAIVLVLTGGSVDEATEIILGILGTLGENDIGDAARYHGHLMNLYLRVKKLQQGIEHGLISLELNNQQQNDGVACLTHTNLSRCYQAIGDLEQAMYHAEKAVELSAKSPGWDIAGTNLNMAVLLDLRGETASAIEHALRALDVAIRNDALLRRSEIEEFLHNVYSSINERDKAYEYLLAWRSSSRQAEERRNASVVLNEEFQRRTAEREAERDAARQEAKLQRRLLEALVPDWIADRMIAGESPIADAHENVAVLFVDIVGFTSSTVDFAPSELRSYIETAYSLWDTVASKHGAVPIKTIGDGWMATIGLRPTDSDITHRALELAVDLLTSSTAPIRIGLHVGPVISGVVSTSRLAFDIWGRTVNLAARLEAAAPPGSVLILSETLERVSLSSMLSIRSYDVDLRGFGLVSVVSITTAV